MGIVDLKNDIFEGRYGSWNKVWSPRDDSVIDILENVFFFKVCIPAQA